MEDGDKLGCCSVAALFMYGVMWVGKVRTKGRAIWALHLIDITIQITRVKSSQEVIKNQRIFNSKPALKPPARPDTKLKSN